MRLPLVAVVAVAIVVIVLVVVVTFFTGGTGRSMTQAQADKIFAEQCMLLCDETENRDAYFLQALPTTNPEFMGACKTKFGTTVPNKCLSLCNEDCSIKTDKQAQLCTISCHFSGSEGFNKEKCDNLMQTANFNNVADINCDVCDSYCPVA